MRILKNPGLYFSALVAMSLPGLAFAEDTTQVECMAMPTCPLGTSEVESCVGKTECEPSSMCGKTIFCHVQEQPICDAIAACQVGEVAVDNCTSKEECKMVEVCGTHAYCQSSMAYSKSQVKDQPAMKPETKPASMPHHGHHEKMHHADKQVMEAAETPKFQWHVYLNNEIYTANNRDFLDVNNETFIDTFDTDDRFTIGKSQISLDVSYDVTDDIRLNVEPTYRAVWGGEGSGIFLRKMNVDWTAFEKGDIKLSTKIGPQPFKIGGADKDFFFSDIATGATLTADLGKSGRLRILAFDISALSDPRKSSYSSFKTVSDSRGGGTAKNFAGDTFTYRTGAVYELTELVKGLQVRAFGFFADIGTGPAPHTGSDRSFHGSHANFSDNDYNWIAGLRAGYQLNGDTLKLHIFGEYARSGGLDRKAIQIGVRDITASGNAFGLGIKPELDLGKIKPRANVRFFLSEGASHTSGEGLAFNYGFVGFNGDQIGGHTVGKGSGWRPSAVLSSEGLTYNPNDFDRQSGTMVVNASVGATIMDKVSIDAGLWFYQDTSSTGITDFKNLSTLAEELPFGYSEADLEGQERFGKTLGIELDGKLGYIAKEDLLDLFVGGGIFLPGDFYKIKIDRTTGSALGAKDPVSFWAVSGGATLKF